MNLGGLTKSLGVKRYVAAILSILISIAASYPEAAPAMDSLQTVAGLFGVTGLIHSIGSVSLDKAKLASLASLFATLGALAVWVPQLQPYEHVFQQIAAFLGTLAAGSVATSIAIDKRGTTQLVPPTDE